jgi:dephospho-CoA kinase
VTEELSRPLRVGLTGNIGSGKSTTAGILAELGCLIIDADRLGHSLLLAKSPAFDVIVEAFGTRIVGADGNVDRAALARVVFASDSDRRRLEEITHPAIRGLELQQIEDRPPGTEIAVTEAALLVESGGYQRYDRIVVVTAPVAVRLQRLELRGMDPQDARRRMGAQMAERLKVAIADYVIDNSGSPAHTRQQVDELHAALTMDAARLRRGDELPPTRGR